MSMLWVGAGVAVAGVGADIYGQSQMGNAKIKGTANPDIGPAGQNTLSTMGGLAPEQFGLSSIYDPQYASLFGGILSNSLLGSRSFDANAALGSMSQAEIDDITAEAKKFGQTPAQWLTSHVNDPLAQKDPATQGLLSNFSARSGGLLSTYSQAAPQLQDIQSGLNTQALQSGLSNFQSTLPQMTSAIANASPQLGAIQGRMTQNALSGQPAAGMVGGPINPLSGLGSWNDPRMSAQAQQINAQQINPASIDYSLQAPQGVSQNNFRYSPLSPVNIGAASTGFNLQSPQQVTPGGNTTLDQLNTTAQQQLALGGQLGQSEKDQIANDTLSYFNTMGRATDPVASANLALNLDSAQQARLQQREQMAGQVSGLTQGQTAQSLQAQQANQGAGLQAQGLGLQAGTTQAQLVQQASLANQQAALEQQGFGIQQNTTGANLTQQAQQANLGANLQFQGMGLGQATTQAQMQQQAALSNQQADLQAQSQNQQASLQAGLANQNAFLAQQGMSLQGMDLYSQLSQQGALANQSAQYNNALFNQNQLGQAGQSLMGTAMPAISAALGSTMYQPVSYQGALSAAGQAGGLPTSDPNFNPLPYAAGMQNENYQAILGRQTANANLQAGQAAGWMSLGGQLVGAGAGMMGGGGFNGFGGGGGSVPTSSSAFGATGGSVAGNTGGGYFNPNYYSMCWVAREVFGSSNPKWLAFRNWMQSKADPAFREFYLKRGPYLAWRVSRLPRIKAKLRQIFDSILEKEAIYA